LGSLPCVSFNAFILLVGLGDRKGIWPLKIPFHVGHGRLVMYVERDSRKQVLGKNFITSICSGLRFTFGQSGFGLSDSGRLDKISKN